MTITTFQDTLHARFGLQPLLRPTVVDLNGLHALLSCFPLLLFGVHDGLLGHLRRFLTFTQDVVLVGHVLLVFSPARQTLHPTPPLVVAVFVVV